MYEKSTGIFTLHAYDFIGPQVLTYKMSNESILPVGTFGEDYDNKCQLQLPYEGRATLLKTHEGLESRKNSFYKEEFSLSKEQREGLLGGTYSGIIRLARNPGDQLFRNALRWEKEAHFQNKRKWGDVVSRGMKWRGTSKELDKIK